MNLRPSQLCRKHPDIVAGLTLLLLPFAILGRAFLPGKVLSPTDNLFMHYPWKAIAPDLLPANPLGLADITFVFHPSLIYAAAEITQGRFPLWNPYQFAGAPFFANPLTALLFPLTALAYVLPMPIALTFISCLKLSAAGLAMYWFLRVLSVTPLAAITGAGAYMLNGTLVVWLQWTFSSTIIFLPLLFGLTELLRKGKDVRVFAALAVAVGFDVFAGYPQGPFHGLLATTAWALSRVRGAPGGVRFLARYATALGLGAALAAVQLLPFVEYLLDSSVLAYRNEWVPTLYHPLRSAVTFLMPYFYGDPTDRTFWGDWNFSMLSVSVGVVPWAVLPLAVVIGWRRTGTKFFSVLAVIAGAVHYGVPVVSSLATLPILALVTNQRLMPLFVVSLCALCALGLDAIAKREHGARSWAAKATAAWFFALVGIAFLFMINHRAEITRRGMLFPIAVQYSWFLLLLTFATLTVLQSLRDRDRPTLLGLALFGLELISLLPLAVTYNPVTDVSWLYPAPPAIRHLQLRTSADKARVLGAGLVGMVYGLFEVTGYDGMTPRRVEQIVGPIGQGTNPAAVLGGEGLAPGTVFLSPAFDLLGIRYVLLSPGAPKPREHWTLDYDGPDARVYRNERALPRAFLVPRARCVDDVTARRLIWEQAVDFRGEVLLADCEGVRAAAARAAASSAEIREYEANRVRIVATAGAPAYLVLTDTWFPGWRVWVNGREHTVWRANHAFRAVELGPGRHEIEFRYRPASFQIGLGLSLLAAGVTGALWLGSRKSRRAPP